MPGAAGPASKATASAALVKYLEREYLVMVILPKVDGHVILSHHEREMTETAFAA